MESSNQEERLRLEAIDKRNNFYSIRNFKLSYNRHENAYNFRVKDFPEEYHHKDSFMLWGRDPDLIEKFTPSRINLKLWIIGSFVMYHLIQWRVKRVEAFDRMKRKE